MTRFYKILKRIVQLLSMVVILFSSLSIVNLSNQSHGNFNNDRNISSSSLIHQSNDEKAVKIVSLTNNEFYISSDSDFIAPKLWYVSSVASGGHLPVFDFVWSANVVTSDVKEPLSISISEDRIFDNISLTFNSKARTANYNVKLSCIKKNDASVYDLIFINVKISEFTFNSSKLSSNNSTIYVSPSSSSISALSYSVDLGINFFFKRNRIANNDVESSLLSISQSTDGTWGVSKDNNTITWSGKSIPLNNSSDIVFLVFSYHVDGSYYKITAFVNFVFNDEYAISPSLSWFSVVTQTNPHSLTINVGSFSVLQTGSKKALEDEFIIQKTIISNDSNFEFKILNKNTISVKFLISSFNLFYFAKAKLHLVIKPKSFVDQLTLDLPITINFISLYSIFIFLAIIILILMLILFVIFKNKRHTGIKKKDLIKQKGDF